MLGLAVKVGDCRRQARVDSGRGQGTRGNDARPWGEGVGRITTVVWRQSCSVLGSEYTARRHELVLGRPKVAAVSPMQGKQCCRTLVVQIKGGVDAGSS
ncbi:hypothetical protein NL676_003938 [Syzygium grande]|nr:hypothetical protein NL676_003938 [Syzygium grande]